MHLTAQLKLLPSASQTAALARTLAVFNAACDSISEKACESQCFRQFDLHKLCYRDTRERFGLSAQSAVRAISKVADAYKLDRNTKRTFRPTGAAAYDNRILSWDIAGSTVSIWSLDGRLKKIPFVCGDRQRGLLLNRKGESDLALVRGEWYLMATCVVPDAAQATVTQFLGVDLGVVKIASDSDGRSYSGSELKSVRYRHRRLRAKLQKKQTRSAKRRLKKLSGKEAHFARHANHVISKEIVACAERTGRIAVEELTGIRDRIRAGRKQRAVLHSWAFAQLAVFLVYKAKLTGVPLVALDPRNSSRECAACGHIDKRNRPSQSTFRCSGCGHSDNADTNAARVIAGRATNKLAVNVAGCAEIGSHNSVTSRCL